jgi:hypothetical protein
MIARVESVAHLGVLTIDSLYPPDRELEWIAGGSGSTLRAPGARR